MQKAYTSGENLRYIFFWKPTPSLNGELTKSCLGQWFKSLFIIDGITYACAEQYMMAQKARLFKDDEILKQILDTNDPKKMKALGQKVKSFNQSVWDANKFDIVLKGNYAKFSQNEELKAFLLATKNYVLVEASPLDKIWGIGLKENDKNAKNPLLWKGKNLLGFALMEVRKKLQHNIFDNNI